MITDDTAGASGGSAAYATGAGPTETVKPTQYDEIGLRYNSMHELPAVQPEKPSVIAALGDVRGKRCLDLACGTGRYTALLSALGARTVHGYDISHAMISGALKTFPPTLYPYLHFAVADCSKLASLPQHDELFDIVFAGWFLNYAGTESELTSMFNVINSQLRKGGRFVGITTNVDDPLMKEDKLGFYGLDIKVLNKEYVAPDTGNEVGILAHLTAHTEPVVHFNCFQFRRDVYERCAISAGLRLMWRDVCVPDDERKEGGYWHRWLERPTISVVEAVSI